jgi:hypothetical protein
MLHLQLLRSRLIDLSTILLIRLLRLRQWRILLRRHIVSTIYELKKYSGFH